MPGTLQCVEVGDALVVYREDADLPALETLAAALAPDPAHVVVVLGPGTQYPGDEWAPVLPVLAAAARDVQLVPGHTLVTTSVKLGQWLATRLGRAVLAHDGVALRASRGALFVPAEHGPGWVRFRSGQEPSSGSRRFPSPGWSCSILECAGVLIEAAVAEPLPGGAWLHPRTDDNADDHADGNADEHRQQLISRLDWRDDHAYVVLGCPGAPPVEAADVEGFWQLLPPGIRAAARFVPYGAIAIPDGQSLGQALADWVGERVTACAEVPWSGQPASGDGDAPAPAPAEAATEVLEAVALSDGSTTSAASAPEVAVSEPVSPPAFAFPDDLPSRASSSGAGMPVTAPEAHPVPETLPEPQPAPDTTAEAGQTVPLQVLLEAEPPQPPQPAQPAQPAQLPRPTQAPQPARAPAAPRATRLDSGPADEVPLPRRAAAFREDAGALAAEAAVSGRQDPPRRTLVRKWWPAVAVAACLVVALPVAIMTPGHPAARTQVLGASRPALKPTIQAPTPTVPPKSSVLSTKPTRRITPTPGHTGHTAHTAHTAHTTQSQPASVSAPAPAPAPQPTKVYVTPTRPVPVGPATAAPTRSTSGGGSGGGSSSPAPKPTPSPTHSTANTCASGWYNATAYVSGDKVSYDGDNWTANQWNYDEVPGGASGAWNNDGSC